MNDFQLIGQDGNVVETSAKNIDLDIVIDAAKTINYENWQAEKNYQTAHESKKQNSFSFLRKIEIVNKGLNDVVNAKLTIDFLPNCISCDPIVLTCLEKGKTTTIDTAINIIIDPQYLYGLNESVNGSMTFTIFDKNGMALTAKTQNIRVLPIEESASEDRSPSVLSSFVTPHDDYVLAIKQRASEIKGKNTGDPSFSGYQARDPRDVLNQIDAIWEALQSSEIAYSNPPASFEKTFQRIRLPRTVFAEKAATCIDFAILFCSVLEAVDLNPILIIVEGHAFCGCWLIEDHYVNSIIDNSTFISNAIAVGSSKIAIYDAVDLAKGSAISPMKAGEDARNDLTSIQFFYALDIRACRAESILPVPTPHVIDGQTKISFEEGLCTKKQVETFVQGDTSIVEGNGSPKSKFDIWEEKLLDLNMRNNMINMKLRGSSIQLLAPSAVDLLDLFQKKPEIGLYPIATEPVNNPRFVSYLNSNADDGEKEKELLSRGLIMTVAANGDPEKNIIALSRRSNTEIEESGCNPLFLTIGAIKWFDTDKAANLGTASLFSPILLIPITLPRRRSGEFFDIKLDLDGIQFNTTVFEYFKQFLNLDFSEFNNLLADKSKPINLQQIYNTIRRKIASKIAWDVMDDFVSISLFSFAHFVMWTDMKNCRDQFLKSPIVASFVNGKKEWEDNPFEVSAKELDDKVKPNELAIPLPADSSQIKAIESSLQGESFILDGPPGTGKSQTIANMITNFLYHGKKVLFVAEKEVALEVVKARLDKLGLGNFCLQVYSAKANKKDVLSQIQSAWTIGSTQAPSEYADKAVAIENERAALNSIIGKLHEPNGYFCSVYDAIVAYLSLSSYKNKTAIAKEYLDGFTLESFRQNEKALSELAQFGKIVGGYFGNPLTLFQSREYSLERRDFLFRDLESISGEANNFAKSYESFIQNNGFAIPSKNANCRILRKILGEYKSGKQMMPSLLSNDEFLNERVQVVTYLQTCQAYAAACEALEKIVRKDVLSLNEKELGKTISQAMKSNIFKRFVLVNRVYKSLLPFEASHKSVRKKEINEILERITDVKIKRDAAITDNAFLNMVFHDEAVKTSKEIGLDLEKAQNTLEMAELLRTIEPFPGSTVSSSAEKIAEFGSDTGKIFSNESNAFINDFDKFNAEVEKLKKEQGFDFYFGADGDKFFSRKAEMIEKVIPEKEKLSEWVDFLHRLDTAEKTAPKELMEQYRFGEISEDDLWPSFENALFYRVIIEGLKKGGLESLSSTEVDQAIAAYKDDLDRFAALSVEETAAKITANYPDNNVKYASSTISYRLSHACSNGGRGISLRSIFDDYGDLVQTICPCLLMSPLSVSQYLKPGDRSFDVVIFDEASQIPTCEAIGAIARAQSVIIAGDNNQMPPTNFFSSGIFSADDDNDQDAAADDLESLLDDAIAMKLPRMRLNCHYRSNHESLIAFSNNKFYENSLVTFPSPSNQISKVLFHYLPNGVYEMGKGVNKPEAAAIVAEVVRRLNDPELCKKSIGIITFNEKQQDLIDDLLSKQFDDHPTLEQNPGGETIFIKNLENVQGDERDVILFSICFAACGKQHRMPLNFGPLSKEGGQRRLNVAVSRARDEMIVFASCQPDEIRSEEAKNEGAEYLRLFLQYAKNGVKTLTNNLTSHIYLQPRSVADFLAKDLTDKGYQVDLNVGSSSFRVDIGIKDPSNPTQYILGVICDSQSYVESATCRDRNIVEPAMLARLHWSIIHVWSVEYFDHRDLVVQRVIAAISNPLKTQPNKNTAAQIVYPIQFKKAEKIVQDYPRRRFYPWTVYGTLPYDGMLTDTISSILQKESPISNSLLQKRIRDIYSLGRIGVVIDQAVQHGLIANNAFGERYLDEVYWWKSESEAKTCSFFRTGGDRLIFDIPYQEIAIAAADVLKIQGPMNSDDLISIIVHIFGGLSVTDKVKEHVGKCLKAALNNGFGELCFENYLFKVKAVWHY